MILFLQKLSMKTRFVWVMIAFLVLFAVFAVFHSTPWGVAQLKAFSGGAGLLDMRFWYTPSQAMELFDTWGAPGRSYFQSFLLPLGLALPPAYSCFLIFLLLYLLKKVNPASPWFYFLPLTALAAGVCDLASSGLTALQLALYPETWALIFWPMAVFTAAKWSLLALALASAVLLTAGHLVQRLGRLAQPRDGEKKQDL